MVALGDRRRNAAVLRDPVRNLLHIGRLERRRGEIVAIRSDVQSDFEALRRVSRCLRICERRRCVNIGGASHAFPVCDRTSCGTGRQKLIEPARGSAVGVIIARHDDDGLLAIGEVPESRQRLPARVHRDDQVGQQPLLLVRLRYRDFVEVDPIGARIPGRVAIELVVRTDRRESIALLRSPRRIALARVDDRSRQVVCERRCVTRANGAERDRWVGRDRCGIGIKGRNGGRAVERVAICGPMELNRLVDDAVACCRR